MSRQTVSGERHPGAPPRSRLTPPDNAKAIVEFNKVIANDPNSAEAETAPTQLNGLQGSAPSASSTPSTKVTP